MPRSNNSKRGFQKGRVVSDDVRKKISKANKGKVRTLEQRKRLSLAHVGKPSSKKTGKIIACPICGNQKYRNLKSIITGRIFCSHSCAAKSTLNGFKKGHKGLNPGKIIHKTDESKIARRLTIYKSWRESVFKRDKWTCQKCKIIGGKLHPHHILNF